MAFIYKLLQGGGGNESGALKNNGMKSYLLKTLLKVQGGGGGVSVSHPLIMRYMKKYSHLSEQIPSHSSADMNDV